MNSVTIVNTDVTNSYRTFIQDESDLDCPITFDIPVLDIGVNEGALWDLYNNRSDWFENFGNLSLHGNDTDASHPFNSFYFDGSHWLESPTGYSGFDMEGLQIGLSGANDPNHKYGIGFHLMLNSYPPTGTYYWFFFVGDINNHYGFRIHDDGHCEYVRKSGVDFVSISTTVFDIDKWYSVYIYHDQSGITPCGLYINGILIGTCDNLLVKSSLPPYTVKHQFLFGKGIYYEFDSVSPTFDSNKAHVMCTYDETKMIVTGNVSYNYQSVAVASKFPHNNGNYYWEIQYIAGTYVWVGVADSKADFTLSPAVIGWVLGTSNGRRWARQTGGGVNWIAATPIGTRIGLAYNGTTQKLSIYYDGVFKGTMPTVITPESSYLVPIVGGNAQFSCSLHAEESSWLYSPPDESYVPLPNMLTPINVDNAPLFKGRGNLIRVTKNPTQNEIDILGNPYVLPNVYCTNYKTNQSYDVTNRIYKFIAPNSEDPNNIIPGYLKLKTPILDTGFYTFYAKFDGQSPIVIKKININSLDNYINSESVFDDFNDIQHTKNIWSVCHKSWGGANGGCVSQLVKIERGIVHCYAYGDQYNGENTFGVNRIGLPTGRKTRIGSCLVSKKYFTPGIFRFKCKYPNLTGACCAIWLFHYEEAYPGDDIWEECISDGLHKSGSDEIGHYIVRNHEIDIETPSATKADPNQENASFNVGRFNSWLGVLRNWSVPNSDVPESDPNYSSVNDPEYWSEYTDTFINFPIGAVNDDEWHDLVIDWNTNPSRIIFSIDNQTITTLTTHIPTIPMRVWFGIWFPSSGTKWAGSNANWEIQDFSLKEFQYTKYEDAPYNVKSETYPNVGLRPLTIKHFTDFV